MPTEHERLHPLTSGCMAGNCVCVIVEVYVSYVAVVPSTGKKMFSIEITSG